MKWNRTFRWALLLCLLLPISGCGSGTASPDGGQTGTPDGHPAETPAKAQVPDGADNQEERTAVQRAVETFGQKLRLVSLLAPDDAVRQSMAEHYGGLVSDELLQQWQDNPSAAPGRTVSSPWPERIDVDAMTKTAEDTYEVTGHIVEVTSDRPDGVARIPVVLTVKQIGDEWRITDVQTAPETNDENSTDALIHTNEPYGFRITLSPATISLILKDGKKNLDERGAAYRPLNTGGRFSNVALDASQ